MPASPGRVVVAALAPTVVAAEATGSGWLTPAESVRLAAMGSAHRRRQFLAGHWLARVVAGGVLGIEVDGCTLVRADDGSPRLQVDGRDSDWHVSLSHSGDWIACALAPAPVGVDLEMPRRRRDLLALAQFAFSPDECRRLAALSEPDRGDEFHRLWSLKEARGKRLGEGLLPRRSRRVTAMPCGAGAADAASWPIGDGTLSVAGTGVGHFVVTGLPVPAAPAFWRYREAESDAG